MLQMHITKIFRCFLIVAYNTQACLSRLAFYVICIQVDHDCENTIVVSFVTFKGLIIIPAFRCFTKASQVHLNSLPTYEH